MPPLIKGPALRWDARQSLTVRLTPFAPASGYEQSDYSAFTLTIRRDPLWPRRGPDRNKLEAADPASDGWPLEVSATGVDVGGVITFSLDLPGGAGEERYALDVWATLEGGPVKLFPTTWLSLAPSVAVI